MFSFFFYFIKCLKKKKKKKLWERSSPLSGWSVWSAKVHYDDLFLGSAQVSLILNAPNAQLSYDGLISHFLGRLGRHWTLGGVRAFHVGHEQAHFLIGPPPLRVQLTVVPKGHLRLDMKAGGQRKTRAKKTMSITATDIWGKYGCRKANFSKFLIIVSLHRGAMMISPISSLYFDRNWINYRIKFNKILPSELILLFSIHISSGINLLSQLPIKELQADHRNFF